ncbi:MAG: DNA methyltransferase, partial [Pirellulaceae bacterium]|nr:DNA methyltransferase [Pirellulaceae bacterium]
MDSQLQSLSGILNQIVCGDAVERLRTLPDESIDCTVTSPPYFQQRDYPSDAQIGAEATPEAFVQRLQTVFGECLRVTK